MGKPPRVASPVLSIGRSASLARALPGGTRTGMVERPRERAAFCSHDKRELPLVAYFGDGFLTSWSEVHASTPLSPAALRSWRSAETLGAGFGPVARWPPDAHPRTLRFAIAHCLRQRAFQSTSSSAGSRTGPRSVERCARVGDAVEYPVVADLLGCAEALELARRTLCPPPRSPRRSLATRARRRGRAGSFRPCGRCRRSRRQAARTSAVDWGRRRAANARPFAAGRSPVGTRVAPH